MMLLVRAVVTGFGLSLGSAIFKKVQSRLGFDDDEKKSDESDDRKVPARDGTAEPLES